MQPEETIGTRIPHHFRRPVERPFTAQERHTTTILFGGLTTRHEQLIQAVFEGCGYRCRILPTPDLAALQLGKEYCNNGQCNPAYFTVGSLIQFLRKLEEQGLSRQEISDRHVFFTAGSCGPCRFGMYESEYRLALKNAGFEEFRVLLFQQDHGLRQAAQEPGLKYTLNFGLGMFNALNLGDVVSDLLYQIRPYEVNPGESDRVFAECLDDLCRLLRDRRPFDLCQDAPLWLFNLISRNSLLESTVSMLGKLYDHLYGRAFCEALEACRDRINGIAVDRTRVKPVVKITGEFWAQTTEGDGNYRMFTFLEQEGAEVQVEPIGMWVTYLLNHARLGLLQRRGLNSRHELPGRWQLGARARNEIEFQKKRALLSLGESFYNRQYRRFAKALGRLAHALVSQDELVRLARPFYHPLARGGEAHLEVGKNIYYTVNRLCHMVLSLKPFGCMPSSQSDGVQSAVTNRFREMIFLPIETSGEGEINAHSRVQMALGEAKVRAREEFQRELAATGKRLDEIRAYAAAHPELRRPFYPVPRTPGVAGTAANFVRHVGDLIDGRARPARGRSKSPR